MPEVAYRSEVRIERVKGPLRRAFLPGEAAPVPFGVHGAVAEHYGRAPGTPPPHRKLDSQVARWLSEDLGATRG